MQYGCWCKFLFFEFYQLPIRVHDLLLVQEDCEQCLGSYNHCLLPLMKHRHNDFQNHWHINATKPLIFPPLEYETNN